MRVALPISTAPSPAGITSTLGRIAEVAFADSTRSVQNILMASLPEIISAPGESDARIASVNIVEGREVSLPEYLSVEQIVGVRHGLLHASRPLLGYAHGTAIYAAGMWIVTHEHWWHGERQLEASVPAKDMARSNGKIRQVAYRWRADPMGASRFRRDRLRYERHAGVWTPVIAHKNNDCQ